jgi:hypothetical protein
MNNLIISLFGLLLFASCSENKESSAVALQYSQKIYEIAEPLGIKSKLLESKLVYLTGKARSNDLDSSDISGFSTLLAALNNLTDESIEQLNKLEEFDNHIRLKEVVLNERQNYKMLINNKYVKYVNTLVNQPDKIESPETFDLLLEILETLIDNQEQVYLTQMEFAAKYNFEMESDESEKFFKYRQQLKQLKNSRP